MVFKTVKNCYVSGFAFISFMYIFPFIHLRELEECSWFLSVKEFYYFASWILLSWNSDSAWHVEVEGSPSIALEVHFDLHSFKISRHLIVSNILRNQLYFSPFSKVDKEKKNINEWNKYRDWKKWTVFYGLENHCRYGDKKIFGGNRTWVAHITDNFSESPFTVLTT
jgi:hypothetical protein